MLISDESGSGKKQGDKRKGKAEEIEDADGDEDELSSMSLSGDEDILAGDRTKKRGKPADADPKPVKGRKKRPGMAGPGSKNQMKSK